MMSSQQKRIDLLTNRLLAITKVTERLKSIDQRFFWYRLSAFLGAWLFAILARFLIPGMAWLWVLISLFVIFLGVVFFHRRLDKIRVRYQIAEEWLKDQIARATLDWDKIPVIPLLKNDPDHPYMNDLNLTGDRSLLQVIDTTNTIGGQKKLFDWFLNPDLELNKILLRQTLIKEIRGLPGFRNQILLLGREVQRTTKGLWDEKNLKAWLQSQTSKTRLLQWLFLLSFLAALNLFLLAMDFFGSWGAYWQFSFLLYFGLYFFQYRSYQNTFQEAFQINKDLQPLEKVLKYLETYPAPKQSNLKLILAAIQDEHQKPSNYLRRIVLISSAASIQNNQILSLLINAILPWDMFFAYILERQKLNLQRYLPKWLSTWYHVEALSTLANFASLNPDYQFPDISQSPSSVIYSAQRVGHPMIRKNEKIVNDFSVAEIGEVAIISGSNMSGKSTFLRTLGVNLVLAYAGSVVNATKMEVCLLRLFTCIQVSDSLKDGFSYFYAEVRRLKMILNNLQETDTLPVFYLIDEIFQGTNHEERRIGSLAYIKALVKANGVGAISTHDIELSKLADQEIRVHNYNFQDSVVAGKMSFDYILRFGPSPTTNALKIMEIEGLPVKEIHQKEMTKSNNCHI